jgi:parallel beta-helix repeat protein
MSMPWFRSRRDDRAARRKLERRRRFSVELMEGRQLLSVAASSAPAPVYNTFTVSSTADSGTGSLRWAITESNQTPGYNTIDFDIPGDYLQTISPQSALPAITYPVTIDGTSEPGYDVNPMIILNGSSAGSSANGLTIESADVTVKGLAIDSFSGDGILVDGGAGDVINADDIGISPPGNLNLGNGILGVATAGNAPAGNLSGVVVESSADVTIENSTVSANTLYGVVLTGSSGSVVQGDDIGTNIGATTAVAYNGASLGNGQIGVLINGGSTSNTVGGTAAGTADVISGNGVYGVYISDSNTNGNVVEGDLIGTDYTGNNALGNDDGVDVANGAYDNTIGGTSTAARDVISGNHGDGVQLSTSGPGDLIEGDFIGIQASVTGALGNGRSGVTIQYGASGDTVSDCVISGNGVNGVWFLAASGDTIEGNLIGTNANGNGAIGNGSDGVAIEYGSTDNTIGGTTTAARNVISGNDWDGVHLYGGGVTGNVVEGNYIGTNAAGSGALANAASGVAVFGGASSNTIGGASTSDRNVISGNGVYGVYISDSGTMYNVVENDFIGTDQSGSFAVPNGTDGVIVQAGASVNALSYDVISGNNYDGVLFTGSGTDYNYVIDSLIGLNATANAFVINPQTYVSNVDGVHITNGAYGTSVAFNTIEGNLTGVEIDGSSTNNGVYDNTIAGNIAYGVVLNGTSGNSVMYNTIDSSDYGLVYEGGSPSGQDYGNSYSGDVYGNVVYF